ncbi:protein mono-ADP-ribosyltransferase PARP12-like [Metopolophium dirhodum]|uniref:protein mono-ADP-ribosyltransferase PARP12-like n=1 Tax=Metopolophium dirhodum TaxID=44670 RepID=UPI00298F8C2F|nr:protein mono-ADP-ribosyltransferase PARP12-like [Metopolophium dirhodum]XP_060879750.1 protein mono-ADP-ribosyltransferase PARP12-like [Metopolophium dirhodum]
MYSSGSSSSRIHTSTLAFTEHAAVDILKYATKFALLRNDHVIHPLLNEMNDKGYIAIKQMVHKTFPNCHINQIRLVHVPQMYGMYMLREEELKLTIGRSVQKKLLFHVTTEARAMESLDSGLDWRRSRRNKFGCGVSFSDDADYANFYADNFTSEETRVIMICSVLVSETYVVPRQNDGNSLVVPPSRADTTVSDNSRVYVKYNDNDFYPLYFVHYRNRPEHLTTSKYFRANSRRAMGHYDRRTIEEKCSDFYDDMRSHYEKYDE